MKFFKKAWLKVLDFNGNRKIDTWEIMLAIAFVLFIEILAEFVAIFVTRMLF